MNILQFLIDIKSRQTGVVGQVRQVQQQLDRTEQSAAKLNTRLGGLRNALASLPGGTFLTNPIVAMTAGIGVVSKLGMEAGKTATSFNVLTGSAEKGGKLLGELRKYANDTIYDPTGTNEAAQTMLGFGVSLNNVMGDLKMLGDVAMGNKQRMSQLALVYGQVAAAGKLQGQDLLQLINTGYNPLLDISAITGKSVAKLRDDMSKGLITFDMLRQAFQRATGEGGKFYNMTNEIAKTPYGRFQQLLGEFSNKLLQLYQIVEPALIPSFNVLSSLLSLTDPIIRSVAAATGWIAKNFEWLGPILLGMVTSWTLYNGVLAFNTLILKGWTVAEWLQVTALLAAEKAQKLLNLAMLHNPITWVALGIGALVTTVVLCWKKFDGFRAGVKATWDVLKGFGGIIKDYAIDRLQGILDGLGSVGKAIQLLFKGDFNGAWNLAKQGADQLTGYSVKRNFVQSVGNLGSSIPGAYQARLAAERTISKPKAAGGTLDGTTGSSGTTPTAATSASEAIVTGGTRNTSITMNIGKFFDNLNVAMNDKTDTSELQRIILECMNRSLEIATSAAR